jgi:lipopolysaccharide biosynthesis regulator YciM
MGIFRQNVRSQLVVAVLAVEQEQIAEGLGWERRVAEQKVEFLEAVVRVFFHPYQGLK